VYNGTLCCFQEDGRHDVKDVLVLLIMLRHASPWVLATKDSSNIFLPSCSSWGLYGRHLMVRSVKMHGVAARRIPARAPLA
jgi:hypothetical protein